MQAVRLPKGGLLTYRFFVEREGDYSLTTVLIPTHAVDAGDIIRYSVTVDDAPAVIWSPKEPFRSEEWKRNVLRAQALRHQKVHLSAGSHQLTIQALDDHVVVDQWKLSTYHNLIAIIDIHAFGAGLAVETATIEVVVLFSHARSGVHGVDACDYGILGLFHDLFQD